MSRSPRGATPPLLALVLLGGALACSATACGDKGGDDSGGTTPSDGGTDGGADGGADGGTGDGGTGDGGATDGGTGDGGSADGGSADGGSADGGTGEDQDEDGWLSPEDCDDLDPTVNPDEVEACDNGKDDDCDGTPNDCGLAGERAAADADALISGRATLAHMGYYAAGRFDLDLDGQGELFLAEHHNDYRDGTGGWLFEAPAGGPLSVDAAAATLVSSTTDTWEGGEAASLGDVDGDGHPDLALGRGLSSLALDEAGAAFLIPGPIRGEVVIEDGTLLSGDGPGDHLAERAIALAGDVDLDGTPDLLLGAPLADASGGLNSGAAYVVPADADAGSVGLRATLLLHGPEVSAYAGADVASAGDVDGDGLDDVLIGATGVSGGDGAAYLVLGGATGTLVLDAADVVIPGPEGDEAAAGSSVTGLSDVDGDGLDDIAIGLPGRDEPDVNAGAAWVFTALAESTLAGGTLGEEDAWAVYSGEAVVDGAGGQVAGVGDTDGDGLPELAIGGTEANSGTGAAWLARPAAGSHGLADALLSVLGEEGGDDFGATVTAAGDLDGDGLQDIALGAFRNDTDSGTQAGTTYVLLGTGW